MDLGLGHRIQNYNYNQDMLEFYSNGAPYQIRVMNGPINFATWSHLQSFFAQDAWTLNRHITLSWVYGMTMLTRMFRTNVTRRLLELLPAYFRIVVSRTGRLLTPLERPLAL